MEDYQTSLTSLKDLKIEVQPNLVAQDNRRKTKKICPIRRSNEDNIIYQNFIIKQKLKTKLDKDLILKSLSSHFIFSSLIQDTNLQQMLVEKFSLCQVPEGKYLMKQNDNASSFFILHEGKLTVEINGQTKRNISPGQGFGELALLYSAPRSASIKAVKLSSLWYIDRVTFRNAVTTIIEKTFKENRSFISKNKFFSCLTSEQKDQIASIVFTQRFPANSSICKEGELASSMFILKSGQLSQTVDGIQLGKVKEGDSFQQYTLLSKNSIRKQTIIATKNSVLLAIGSQEIEKALGNNLAILILRNKARQALLKSNYFKNLDSIYIEKIIDLFKVQKVNEKQKVIKKGTKCKNNIFFIVQGNFDISDKKEIRHLYGHHSVGKQSRESTYNFELVFLTAGKIAKIDIEEIEKKIGLTIQQAQAKGKQLNKIIEKQADSKLQKKYLTEKMSLSELKVLKKIGQGQFGVVYLVCDKLEKSFFALKCISKAETVKNKLQNHLLSQKKVLQTVNTSFVVNYFRSFRDTHYIYFLMEFINGIQLFDAIRIIGLLSVQQSKFYAALMLHVIESLHTANIIYRDLKPQNIMVEEDGYIKLVDMGTCKQINKKAVIQKTFTIIGTPSYMAPQVLAAKGYTYNVDLWSLGIMIFQFLAGYLPFGENVDDPYLIYEQILNNPLVFPENLKDLHAKALITQLLNKNAEARLGGSYSALKNSSFFQTIDWNSLIDHRLPPPLKIPKNKLVNFESLKKDIKPLNQVLKPSTKVAVQRKDLNPNWDQEF